MKPLSFALIAPMLIIGCGRSPLDQTAKFEPNLVHAMKYQIKNGVPMDQALQDANWIVDGMFGSPDEPKLPSQLLEGDLSGLISMDRLKQAAGPESEGQGLYRKHCVSCHGITGNGRGERSAALDPYPRDYRPGIFKFKSTKRGSKPTRDDLASAIGNGIAGTAMVKIPELSDGGVQALVDYVIYLSIRGELERDLIDDAVNELDLESGDRIVDREFGDPLTPELREKLEQQVKAWQAAGEPENDPAAEIAESLERFDESMEIANEFLEDIAADWLDAEDDVIEVPDPPESIPVANSYEEFVELSTGDQAQALQASVNRGREVFTGKIASCSKCHGEKGLGDGQNKDYDDWTKDWTVRAGLVPEDTEALIPLMARGAMLPKNAMPRNFAEGVFRGGASAADLYRRISQGIEGSPMPASTFVPGEFDKDDIWNLINFIRSLKQAEPQT